MSASDKKKISIAAFLVISFLSYTLFIYASLPVTQYAISAKAINGKLVWQNKNCNACHQIYGQGGYIGPDLTNVYSLKGADYIKAFINNGTLTMPKFNLDTVEVNEIVAFLQNIDSSGSADPRTFSTHLNGSIEQ